VAVFCDVSDEFMEGKFRPGTWIGWPKANWINEGNAIKTIIYSEALLQCLTCYCIPLAALFIST
jgi:hypothetical protein